MSADDKVRELLRDLGAAVQTQNVSLAAQLLEGIVAAGEITKQVVNARDEEGETLLHRCAHSLGSYSDGQGELMMDLLLSHGADVDLQNDNWEPPLAVAVRHAARLEPFPGEPVMEPDVRLGAVQRLLEVRASANVADAITGETPLMEAACVGDAPLCSLLLGFGADPKKGSQHGATAADFASAEVPGLVELLSAEAPLPPIRARAGAPSPPPPPRRPPPQGRQQAVDEEYHPPSRRSPAAGLRADTPAAASDSRPLVAATRRGDVDQVRQLLAAATTESGMDGMLPAQLPLAEALVAAVRLGDEPLTQLLLVCRADPLQGPPGSRALDAAIGTTGSRLLSAFVSIPDLLDTGDAHEDLHDILAEALTETLRELVRSADVHLVRESLENSTHLGPVPGARALGEALNHRDSCGRSLLHLCVEAEAPAIDRWGVLDLLLDAGAQGISSKNRLGETPLHIAVRTAAIGSAAVAGWSQAEQEADLDDPELRVVFALLAAKASPNTADAKQETPLMEAASAGNADICSLLLNARAEPRSRSATGLCPLDFAHYSSDLQKVFSESIDAWPARAPEQSSSAAEQLPSRSQTEQLLHAPDQLQHPPEVEEPLPVPQLLPSARRTDWSSSAAEAMLPTGESHQPGHLPFSSRQLQSKEAEQLSSVLRGEEHQLPAPEVLLSKGKLPPTTEPLQSVDDAEEMPPILEQASLATEQLPSVEELLLDLEQSPSPRQQTASTLETEELHSAPEQLPFASERLPSVLEEEELTPAPEQVPSVAEHLGSDAEHVEAEHSPSALERPMSPSEMEHVPCTPERALAAVKELDIECLEWIIAQGSSAEKQAIAQYRDAAEDQKSLLHLAVQASPTEAEAPLISAMIWLLLAAGADVHQPDLLGETPLVTAVQTASGIKGAGRLDVIRALIDVDAELNVVEALMNETPLMFAAGEEDLELCQLLLSSRADPLQRNANGLLAADFVGDPGSDLAQLLKDEARAAEDNRRKMERVKAIREQQEQEKRQLEEDLAKMRNAYDAKKPSMLGSAGEEEQAAEKEAQSTDIPKPEGPAKPRAKLPWKQPVEEKVEVPTKPQPKMRVPWKRNAAENEKQEKEEQDKKEDKEEQLEEEEDEDDEDSFGVEDEDSEEEDDDEDMGQKAAASMKKAHLQRLVGDALSLDMEDEQETRLKAEREEVRLMVEQEAKLKAEEEARPDAEMRFEEEARERAEKEARLLAEERLKAEAEKRRKAAETRRKLEEDARLKVEIEERLKAEEDARRKAEEEARLRADEEAKLKAEQEARLKAEEVARQKAQEKEKLRLEQEARLAEHEARCLESLKNGVAQYQTGSLESLRSQRAQWEKQQTEEVARQKAEEKAKLKAEEESRIEAEREAQRKAEEEKIARIKAKEEARLQAEEEARIKIEREARLKAHEEARRNMEAKFKAEEEARVKLELEARLKAQEERQRKAEEEEIARLKAEEEENARLKAEEEARLQAEEEARLKAEEAARLEAEEAARLEAEEAARLEAEEAARLEAEEAARLEAEEAARLEAEEAARLEAEEAARLEAQEAARLEAARLEAARLEAARLEAARLEAARLEAARLEAEEVARLEAEEAARLEAEEAARLEAEEAARLEAEEAARLEAEEAARLEAEEAARLEAEEAARLEAEAERLEAARLEAARLQAEEFARLHAEEEARREAEERAWQKAKEDARLRAEAEARLQAEDEARRQAEEARRRAEEEVQRKAAEASKLKAEEEAQRRKEEEEAALKAEKEAKMKAAVQERLRAEIDRSTPAPVDEFAAAKAQQTYERLQAEVDRSSVASGIEMPEDLLEAVQAPSPPSVRRILKSTKDAPALLKWRDEDGNTLLHLLVLLPPTDKVFAIATVLLTLKAEIDPQNILGETPLMVAARAAMDEFDGSPESPTVERPAWLRPTRVLLEKGANVNARETLTGETPLIEAASRGHIRMCNLLLEFRADANITNHTEYRALEWAESGGHKDVVALLRGVTKSLNTEEESTIGTPEHSMPPAKGSSSTTPTQTTSSTLTPPPLSPRAASECEQDRAQDPLPRPADSKPPASQRQMVTVRVRLPLRAADVEIRLDAVGTIGTLRAELIRQLCEGPDALELANLNGMKLTLFDPGAPELPLSDEKALGEPRELLAVAAAAVQRPSADFFEHADQTSAQTSGHTEEEFTEADMTEETSRQDLRSDWTETVSDVDDPKGERGSMMFDFGSLEEAAPSPSPPTPHEAQGETFLPEEKPSPVNKRTSSESQEEIPPPGPSESEMLLDEGRQMGVDVEWCKDLQKLQVIIASLKSWDKSSVKNLKIECAERRIPVEGLVEKGEILVRIRQVEVWKKMPDDILRSECRGYNVPFMRNSALTKLVEAVYGKLPVSSPTNGQAKAAVGPPKAASRVHENASRVHEAARASAKTPAAAPERRFKAASTPSGPSFTASAPSKAKAAATDARSRAASTTKVFPPNVAFPRKAASAAAEPDAKKRNMAAKKKPKKQAWGREDDYRDDQGSYGFHNNWSEIDMSNLTPRVRKALEKFPNYSGEMPPEEAEELWTDEELHSFFFSSGFIRPKKKNAKPKLSPVVMAQHYATLNVPNGSKAEIVRKAYRKLALQHHPDKNPSAQDATRFQEIKEAYEAVCHQLQEFKD